jgi:hypothetical protein
MMGPLSALLIAALGTAAPDEREAPRDPFAAMPEPATADEPPPPPPPPRTASVRGQLRDPFVAPLPAGTRKLSADLKDPFAVPPGSRESATKPIRDLRDPFVPRPDGARPGECLSAGGVPVQRPKGMPPKRCPDPPLLNPFSAA